jgi:UDP-N-acetylmuramate dehydrogenase
VSLAPLTSWQVGGPADFLAEPRTLDELFSAVQWARARNLAITILGGGTNVLVSDRGVRGLTIALRKFAGVRTEVRENPSSRRRPPYPARENQLDPGADAPGVAPERLHIECLAGTSKSELLKIFLRHKLMPALFMAGLPGDVGGGIAMNAGVGEKITPREFVEITDWIDVLRWDGTGGETEIARIEAADLEWSYRHCRGWQPGVIVRAGLSWPLASVPDVLERVRAANLLRAQKQPLDMPSCGSVFINPPGHTSGQLIERTGLKGFAIGGAKVSEKHANFIVNFNRATAADINAVIRHVQTAVRAASGVELRTEVVYLGEW